MCAHNRLKSLEIVERSTIVAAYNRLKSLEIAERSAIVAAILSGELYWTKAEIAQRCAIVKHAYHELGVMLGEVEKNEGAATKRGDALSPRLDTRARRDAGGDGKG